MSITHEIDVWLSETYENHCFISWPHIKNRDLAQCAQAVKNRIEEELSTSFSAPVVFLDESEIVGGDVWEARLRRALCKSVSMIAICAPIYYRPEHRWCGLEWAAMEHLSSSRLQNQDLKAIIPLMFRKVEPLPPVVSRIQHIDISKVSLQGRRYFNNPEFRAKIQQMANRIELIAEELWRGRSKADCDLFQFPDESAFSAYNLPSETLPLTR